ncbi:hypothetical protein [Thermoactinospora rubra]|uniref:hypothetical protein n=1 Tax=Thermoactinospora rubra TaxID=1088767 RepID=UPI000A1040E9|nr:hypothetical protein [Thermoactinospora rubra]
MSRLGPFVTLAAGAVLAAGLGVASATAAPAGETVAAAEQVTGATAQTTSAPGEEAAKPVVVRADYAGRVERTRALIAVSIRGAKAIGYFCDGKTEAWFIGPVDGDKVKLKGFGDAKLNATFGGGRAEGVVALGGKEWDFVAPTVKKPSGLYRATRIVRGAKIKASWIYLANPNGDGFIQVGTASVNDSRVTTPTFTPDRPINVNGEYVVPEDVDGFVEEMS